MKGVRVKELKGKASADYCVESKTELKDAGVIDVHTLVPNKAYKPHEYDLFRDLVELPSDHPLRHEVQPIVRLRVRANNQRP